ncbi:uncharacterized protein LOC142220623 [Haematobia irritans]|uniref:uncharacterized protein LOC142220623 n=1 Tax=Haematobia irritans TaxID=7368 RepID=UPI003F4FC39B
MESREDLIKKLRYVVGSDEFPLVRKVKITSLSTEKIIKLLVDRNFMVENSMGRSQLEGLLKQLMGGSDYVINVDEVKIESMLYNELKASLLQLGYSENVQTSNRDQTIRDKQQTLAENCGFGKNVTWDHLPEKDSHIMKRKIENLIPDQEKGQKSIEEMRENIYQSVWAQRKYTNRNSLTSIFYVMVTSEKSLNLAPESTKFSCHPIFRCRKCVSGNSNSSNCCMVYVDETGRVYQNWKSFIEENLLPGGIMVAPRKGIYNFDKDNKVILDVYRTPNGTEGAQLLNAAQSGSAILGLGSACIPLAAALSVPVAAPVMAAAGVVALGVGAFTSITSALNLIDRSKHEQSVAINDRQARASYLGVAGGVLGVASAGATRAMTSMAAAGKATMGIEALINGLNISSIVLSGSGVANGVLDLIFKFQDDDQISALDALQLSASLVLFTHSVYNFQLASNIANEARTNSIKSYRETLSNRQRRMFDKISKETIRIRGDTQGKIDIVRNINKIPERKYLNDLFKVNKNMNKANVRPAFSSSEGVVLNNDMSVDTTALRQNINLLEQVSKPIPTSHQGGTTDSSRLFFAGNGPSPMIECTNLHDALNDTYENITSKLNSLVLALPNGFVIHLKNYGKQFLNNIADGKNFQDILESMGKNFEQRTVQFLLKIAKNFIDEFLEEITGVVGIYISTESVIYRILKYVLKNYKNWSYVYIAPKASAILIHLKTYFLSLNPNAINGRRITCDNCNGYYSICGL